ncbi:hypothetical protein [Bacillus sp. PS06]|uniref:hypothetical protein n=1 Tax=Bacillus sp. PS06 TaxID=2764176 RepID=UPI00177BC27A|nr:hypothetical protein [Bacillus sp. PS06]MBD8069439.1 hypothetical protein [Bacillus sp. PS06]
MLKTKKVTLPNLQMKMQEESFDPHFIKELHTIFQKQDPIELESRLENLHYRLPTEFEDEDTCIRIYQLSQDWIEQEVTKLEDETELSWQVQAEDLKADDERVRKTQVVIRHRLSEIVYELI